MTIDYDRIVAIFTPLENAENAADIQGVIRQAREDGLFPSLANRLIDRLILKHSITGGDQEFLEGLKV